MITNPASPVLAPAEMAQDARLEHLLPGAIRKALVHEHPSSYFVLPSTKTLAATTRLVLLVPDGEIDIMQLARFVTRLVELMDVNVHVIGLYNNSRPLRDSVYWEVASLEPLLNSQAARIRAELLSAAQLLAGANKIFQPGDLCLCFEKHQVLRYGLFATPVVSLISRNFEVPVYVIRGWGGKLFSPVRRSLKEVSGWALALGLIAANFAMLLRVYQETSGLSQIVLALGVILISMLGMQALNNWMG